MRVQRKTLIAALFASFLLSFCVATFFLTLWSIKERDPVAGFFAAAALVMAVFMLVLWLHLWIRQIKRRAEDVSFDKSFQDGPWGSH